MTYDRRLFFEFNAGTKRAINAHACDPITSPSYKCPTQWCPGYVYREGATCDDCLPKVREVIRLANEIREGRA